MFGFLVPLLFFSVLVFVPASISIYYGALVTGTYNDLAPLCWFLVSLGC